MGTALGAAPRPGCRGQQSAGRNEAVMGKQPRGAQSCGEGAVRGFRSTWTSTHRARRLGMPGPNRNPLEPSATRGGARAMAAAAGPARLAPRTEPGEPGTHTGDQGPRSGRPRCQRQTSPAGASPGGSLTRLHSELREQEVGPSKDVRPRPGHPDLVPRPPRGAGVPIKEPRLFWGAAPGNRALSSLLPPGGHRMDRLGGPWVPFS